MTLQTRIARLRRGRLGLVPPMLRWPAIALVRVARYAILLDLRGNSLPQRIRVAWTKLHLGGEALDALSALREASRQAL
jgi:hypothetical protein